MSNRDRENLLLEQSNHIGFLDTFIYMDPLEQFEYFAVPSYSLAFNFFGNMDEWFSHVFMTHIAVMFMLIRLAITTWFIKPTMLSTWETQDYWMTKNKRNVIGYNVWWQDLGFRVQSALKQNIQLKNSKRGIYWANLFSSFFFILHANLLGLIPYAFTLTSSFVITFLLASNTFIGSFFVGLYIWDWKFVNITAPGGVMIEIIYFLIVIEFISYIARLFSLSIRLFANMMSGHALLKILISFAYTMLKFINVLLWIMAAIIWTLITLIMFLELLIAFLQAYIFMVLSMIYLNDIFAFH